MQFRGCYRFAFIVKKHFRLFILMTISMVFSSLEYRKKLKRAEGEEEIRQITVPLILSTLFFILFIILFFV